MITAKSEAVLIGEPKPGKSTATIPEQPVSASKPENQQPELIIANTIARNLVAAAMEVAVGAETQQPDSPRRGLEHDDRPGRPDHNLAEPHSRTVSEDNPAATSTAENIQRAAGGFNLFDDAKVFRWYAETHDDQQEPAGTFITPDIAVGETLHVAPETVSADALPDIRVAPNTAIAVAYDSANNKGFQVELQADSPVRTESLDTAITAWGEELAKEPTELLEDFTATVARLAAEITGEDELIPFIQSPAVSADIMPRMHEEAYKTSVRTMEPASIEQNELHPLPSSGEAPAAILLNQVAEHLTALDPSEKPMAAVALRQVMGAVHGLHILRLRQAPRERIEAITVQLPELVETFFATLGIPPTAENIDHFIRIICTPEFRPKTEETTGGEQLDLTRAGMHNAKHTTLLSMVTPDLPGRMTKLLGMVALVYDRMRGPAVQSTEPVAD